MPELPEITLFKSYFDETSLHQKIKSIDFLHTGSLQSSKNDFVKALEGKEFTETRRLGKYLLIKTSGDKVLVMHFGMTGELEYYRNQDPPKYARVIYNFSDDAHLGYLCRRKLGKLFLADSEEEFKKEHSLGTDALELKEKDFMELLEDK
ncbi:DNA-formamidopyrimidine glycosylase family protein, partial [Longispora fulva]|uniref:DNA-formamidopyrimidine glycosylase family protein n=1 Tax=Longispora fulva TaxID=619741 RepID=UPI00362F770B